MAAKRVKIIIALILAILLILPLILWFSIGRTTIFFALLAIDIALILLVFGLGFFQYSNHVDQRQASMVRRSVGEVEELRIEYSFLRKVAGLPTKFRYEALVAATDNFQTLIGRGSSGSVFKGILDDGTSVAVKRIEVSEHGVNEFRSEVTAIASIQHLNLVRLLGYCIVPRVGARFLVYDFVNNGSLDKWIFPRKGNKPADVCKCLPWALRYRVAVEVAKALAYLHNDCRRRILHLDVKPENILLNENFRALVTDFGLSKLMGRDESRIVTSVRGTRGYLAPEWFIGRGVSERCDIFSYGMVLLELVAGRRSVRLMGDAAQREWSYLPRIVTEKVMQGKVMEVVDDRLIGVEGGGVDEREVRTLVYVALWCIREDAKMRPGMGRVVDMLEGRTVVEAPPPDTEMLILNLLSMEHTAGRVPAAPGGIRQLDRQSSPVSSSCSFAMTMLSGR